MYSLSRRVGRIEERLEPDKGACLRFPMGDGEFVELPGCRDMQDVYVKYVLPWERERVENHVWTYDFLYDQTADGRRLKLLAVVDEFTRECLTLEVERRMEAQDVMGVLEALFAVRGTPRHLRSDNGPEFVSRRIQAWLAQRQTGPAVHRAGQSLGECVYRIVQQPVA
jgi:transposase InsO family protein